MPIDTHGKEPDCRTWVGMDTSDMISEIWLMASVSLHIARSNRQSLTLLFIEIHPWTMHRICAPIVRKGIDAHWWQLQTWAAVDSPHGVTLSPVDSLPDDPTDHPTNLPVQNRIPRATTPRASHGFVQHYDVSPLSSVTPKIAQRPSFCVFRLKINTSGSGDKDILSPYIRNNVYITVRVYFMRVHLTIETLFELYFKFTCFVHFWNISIV